MYVIYVFFSLFLVYFRISYIYVMVLGQYPPGQYPPGQYPPAQKPPDNIPPDNIPPGQNPPGQYPPVQYPPSPTSPWMISLVKHVLVKKFFFNSSVLNYPKTCVGKKKIFFF